MEEELYGIKLPPYIGAYRVSYIVYDFVLDRSYKETLTACYSLLFSLNPKVIKEVTYFIELSRTTDELLTIYFKILKSLGYTVVNKTTVKQKEIFDDKFSDFLKFDVKLKYQTKAEIKFISTLTRYTFEGSTRKTLAEAWYLNTVKRLSPINSLLVAINHYSPCGGHSFIRNINHSYIKNLNELIKLLKDERQINLHDLFKLRRRTKLSNQEILNLNRIEILKKHNL